MGYRKNINLRSGNRSESTKPETPTILVASVKTMPKRVNSSAVASRLRELLLEGRSLCTLSRPISEMGELDERILKGSCLLGTGNSVSTNPHAFQSDTGKLHTGNPESVRLKPTQMQYLSHYKMRDKQRCTCLSPAEKRQARRQHPKFKMKRRSSTNYRMQLSYVEAREISQKVRPRY